MITHFFRSRLLEVPKLLPANLPSLELCSELVPLDEKPCLPELPPAVPGLLLMVSKARICRTTSAKTSSTLMRLRADAS